MSTFIHPTAIVETQDIGDGTKIWAFSHISRGAKIGKNCMIGEGVHVGTGVVIGDGCRIQNHSLLYEGVTLEDEVFIGPNVITTNDCFPRAVGEWKHRFKTTLIKRRASVAANCTILCGITLGENCMVGAGSTVTKSVKDNYIAYGNPARHIRKVDDPQ